MAFDLAHFPYLKTQLGASIFEYEGSLQLS